MEMLSKKVPNCAKRQPAENPSAGCLTVCCCFLSASPDPVELASPFPQALVQPGAQGCHALLCPGEGLRLNVLGLFKADVLIDPGLDGAIVHLSRPLEAVAEGAEGELILSELIPIALNVVFGNVYPIVMFLILT